MCTERVYGPPIQYVPPKRLAAVISDADKLLLGHAFTIRNIDETVKTFSDESLLSEFHPSIPTTSSIASGGSSQEQSAQWKIDGDVAHHMSNIDEELPRELVESYHSLIASIENPQCLDIEAGFSRVLMGYGTVVDGMLPPQNEGFTTNFHGTSATCNDHSVIKVGAENNSSHDLSKLRTLSNHSVGGLTLDLIFSWKPVHGTNEFTNMILFKNIFNFIFG